jgi:hypothetical protein
MSVEYYKGHNPAGAMMAEAMLKRGAPIKLKFVTVKDDAGQAVTHVFTGDEHAGVLGDLLGVQSGEVADSTAEVRSRLVSAGIIQNGEVMFGSESIARIFGIPEEEQTIEGAAEVVRGKIENAMSA